MTRTNPQVWVKRTINDPSSLNLANCNPTHLPLLSQLLWSDKSASAARTQHPGVDRVWRGPGKLTLLLGGRDALLI
jgi:hypothetical protein